MKTRPTPEMKKLLSAVASRNPLESAQAADIVCQQLGLHAFGPDNAPALADAVTETVAEDVIRKGVMPGDIVSNIYQTRILDAGEVPEYPVHFLAPGTEKDYTSYVVPGQGMIPDKRVTGDSVMVPTYTVGNGMSVGLDYVRNARWDVVGDLAELLRDAFVKKFNDDGWHVLLAAATDRNIVIYDSDATAGQFTKRLISLMKVAMRRNGGGNSTSVNRGKLTDLYVSPEALEDMRNWNIDQVDEVTRRELLSQESTETVRFMGLNIHPIDELGESQDYQTFFTYTLGGTLGPSSDVELVVGLDLSPGPATFVKPVRLVDGQQVAIYEDPTYHRRNLASWYGRGQCGWAVLDNRKVLLGSF